MSVTPTQRLFFALLPTPMACARIAEVVAGLTARHAPGGRAIAPEQWHVTLCFLGDFHAGSDAAERAHWAGERVRAEPFELVLDAAASFPGARPPWVLCGAQARARLQPLHASLRRALAEAGFGSGEAARDFVPHLTLVRHAVRALAPQPVAPAVAWTVREFALLESLPAQRRYQTLARWTLGAAAADPSHS